MRQRNLFKTDLKLYILQLLWHEDKIYNIMHNNLIFVTTLFGRLLVYVMVDIWLTCGILMHDRIIWVTRRCSITLPLFIEVLVPSHNSDLSYTCMYRFCLHVYNVSNEFWNCSDSVVFLFIFLNFIKSNKHVCLNSLDLYSNKIYQ